MQNGDGGWGWFSAWGEHSYPHTTAVVVHGLLVAKDNGADVPDDMLKRGVAWLKKHEEKEAERIRMWKKRKQDTKQQADAMDALVRRVLGEAGVDHKEMLDFLFRDKVDLPVYAKCLLGLELHRVERHDDRDAVIHNIEQFLKTDDENQTAYLEPRQRRLLVVLVWQRVRGPRLVPETARRREAEEPAGPRTGEIPRQQPQARDLLELDPRHRLLHRGHRRLPPARAARTRPDMEVEVLLDGKVLKTVKITKENLFTFDGTAVVAGDVLGAGKHTIELRKKGRGPLVCQRLPHGLHARGLHHEGRPRGEGRAELLQARPGRCRPGRGRLQGPGPDPEEGEVRAGRPEAGR